MTSDEFFGGLDNVSRSVYDYANDIGVQDLLDNGGAFTLERIRKTSDDTSWSLYEAVCRITLENGLQLKLTKRLSSWPEGWPLHVEALTQRTRADFDRAESLRDSQRGRVLIQHSCR